MIPPAPHNNTTLVLRRTFTASCQRVFRAWIEPEALEHWLRPRGIWQLTPVHNGTNLIFTYDGFAQVDERYEITSAWWEHFLASLKSYLETEIGNPGSPLTVM